MNSSNKVSIVMSVFGYKEYIEESIESILGQNFKDFEFIIIDDGCGYDLYKKIEKFNDTRINYIKNKKNIGLTKSLIKGISISKGRYIARHDAGNISLQNRLGIQYNFLESNNDYYLVGSSAMLIDGNGEEICKIIANSSYEFIREKLPESNFINHSSIMFRNSDNYTYRPKFKYSQDYDFYLYLLSKNQKIGAIPEVLLKERLLPGSITYSKRNYQLAFENIARKYYFERLKCGRDSYNTLSVQEDVESAVKKNKGVDNLLFFNRQKAYYLLYSRKLKKVRKLIREALKRKFDLKLFAYLILSNFPFLIKLISRIKKVEFM